MKVNCGLDANTAQLIADTLTQIIANTHTLYIKTLNYHWNLEDSRFASLHSMLQDQYEMLADSLDEYAERIRMLGLKAPATVKEWSELTTLKEGDHSKTGDAMLDELAADHEVVICDLRDAIKSAEQAGDPGTADLLINTLRAHEKTAWFLRSHL